MKYWALEYLSIIEPDIYEGFNFKKHKSVSKALKYYWRNITSFLRYDVFYGIRSSFTDIRKVIKYSKVIFNMNRGSHFDSWKLYEFHLTHLKQEILDTGGSENKHLDRAIQLAGEIAKNKYLPKTLTIHRLIWGHIEWPAGHRTGVMSQKEHDLESDEFMNRNHKAVQERKDAIKEFSDLIANHSDTWE